MQRAEFLKKLPVSNNSIHCIGIGGIGVSALAELLHEGGFKVSGSDVEYNSICRYLTNIGVQVAPAGHRAENVPDDCGAVIMTAAASVNNPEAAKLLQANKMAWSRGEFLGELCRCYQRPVMVAGSHGKSSTSAMLGWILQKLNLNAGLLIGARYNSDDRNARLGNGDILLAEADESDGTHALLSGELALITNIDGDHAWNDSELKEQERRFRIFAKSFRKTLYVAEPGNCRILGAAGNAEAIPEEKFHYLCSLVPENMLGYERNNAALALAGAEYLQIDLMAAAEALKSYPGIKRRQMVSAISADKHLMVLEDYAHHPRELACSLDVIKMRYPEYDLQVVFQPHRYRRLLHYFNDFVKVLSNKNISVKVLPVFCAWEQPLLDGKESVDLVCAINNAGGNAELL
ncbi:MAG: hypothetical protein J6Q81_05545, partial [Lentisphaeria bacterium]|nr:hypothetical protein [Lentisphaeria bacterium]